MERARPKLVGSVNVSLLWGCNESCVTLVAEMPPTITVAPLLPNIAPTSVMIVPPVRGQLSVVGYESVQPETDVILGTEYDTSKSPAEKSEPTATIMVRRSPVPLGNLQVAKLTLKKM
jgi:hypothetical protein